MNFTTADGCQQELYTAQDDGGYALILQDVMQELSTETLTILTITKQGTGCGDTASADTTCTRRYTMDEAGTLTPLE